MSVTGKPRLVVVWWLDAANGNGWESLEAMKNTALPLCVSVGFLVDEDKDKIVLAAGYEGEDGIGYMAIPIGMIAKKKFVKY